MLKKLAVLSGVALLLSGALLCAVLYAPRLLGLSAYRIQTGSMAPCLMPGDTAYVAGLAPREGDVAAFYDAEGDLVLHRVEELSGNGIVTKGDANPVRDAGTVPVSSVEGRVVFSLPGGGVPDALMSAMAVSALCAGAALSAAGAAMKSDKKGERYVSDE